MTQPMIAAYNVVLYGQVKEYLETLAFRSHSSQLFTGCMRLNTSILFFFI